MYILKRLNKEKAALQMTAELLTIRLNSVNEILALQEEKMVKEVGVLNITRTLDTWGVFAFFVGRKKKNKISKALE